MLQSNWAESWQPDWQFGEPPDSIKTLAARLTGQFEERWSSMDQGGKLRITEHLSSWINSTKFSKTCWAVPGRTSTSQSVEAGQALGWAGAWLEACN